MTDEAFVTDAPPEIYHALGDEWPTRQQWDAISAPLEPCVLIAGAGSGKTAVMAARIVWLILGGHAKASEILGLTFTNKAAGELLQRVRHAVVPLGLPEGEEPTIATYHAFAASLIRDYGLRAGIEPGAALMSEAQAWQLCADLYAARTYRHMEVRTLWHVPWVRHLADDCANHLVDPAELIAYDQDFLQRIERSEEEAAPKAIATARKRMEMAAVVADYRDAKRARNLIDYGDQIRLAHEIAQDPAVVADLGARYRFALLDEYQDTNVAQARMLKALMPDGYPVMAVGDPDQNIYAWRGASLHNLLAFQRQFPRADGSPASRLPLEVNFRSGRRILDLANEIIKDIPPERRPSDKVLRHHPPLGDGEVAILAATDQVAEAERLAEQAERAHDGGVAWGEMAILCRKKRLFGSFLEAFRAREIPLEVIGLGGLLEMPEVIDLVSLLRVLDDPMRNVALARLLRGPRWRVGHRDLALIARHAAARNAVLREAIGEDRAPGDVAFSLAEALADTDEVEGLSDGARARIARFSAELEALRRHAHLPLPELVATALETLGLVGELDASASPAAPAAKRNLANFLDRVASFAPLDGEPTLGALIEWLDAVEESDEEIEASQPTSADAVKLMTIHQAKGLEFDVVFVPGLARQSRSQIFPDTTRQANPVTAPRFIPFELRGDNEVLPRFDGRNLTRFGEALKARAEEEERRLLYVALTRARKRLVCSAAYWYYPSGMGEALQKAMDPSEYWHQVRAFPEVDVIVEAGKPETNPLIERRAQRAANWPPAARRAPDPLFPEGLAEAVAGARAGTEPDETLFPVAPAPAPGSVIPRQLAATSIVTYATCPKRFYWSHVRPLPRRVSPAARIGTLVHAWIEQHGRGQLPLYDADEFAEPGEQASRAAEAMEAFKGSRFAGARPNMTEQSFSLVAGDFLLHGRIDAVLAREAGGWEIVDWKSGSPPEADGAEAWQLDLYALAAQEIWGRKPDELTLTFVYLGGDGAAERSFPARPAEEIRADLAAALERIAAGSFEARPSRACRTCDFLRDCPEGRAFAGDAAR